MKTDDANILIGYSHRRAKQGFNEGNWDTEKDTIGGLSEVVVIVGYLVVDVVLREVPHVFV